MVGIWLSRQLEKVKENQEQHEGDTILTKKDFTDVVSVGNAKRTAIRFSWGDDRILPCLCRCDRERLEKLRRGRPKKGICNKSELSEICRADRTTVSGVAV